MFCSGLSLNSDKVWIKFIFKCTFMATKKQRKTQDLKFCYQG